jgi:endo-1,4-beta-xylanase
MDSNELKTQEKSVFTRRKFIQTTALTATSLAMLKANAISGLIGNSGLKDVFKGDFLVGAAIGSRIIMRNNTELLGLVAREFNAITSENAMKWGLIHPKEDVWNFEEPDKLLEFAEKNDMHVQGHVLVWHSQAPGDLFSDASGIPVSKEILMKRLEYHILTLVDKYRGRVHSWDVVNEAITPEGFRKSKWFNICGKDFIERAFHLAHEADPKCQLIYNDFNEENPKKRNHIIAMVNDFKKRGIPVHGIGMQGHLNLNGTNMQEWEKSIEAFAEAGMRVSVTELDVDVLPFDWAKTAEISFGVPYSKEMDPYIAELPKEIDDKLTLRYEEIFKILLKHRDKLDRVTFWGVSDDTSWKNNFPMRGRTNYPLLFDRKHKPKNAYHAVTSLKRTI